MALVKTPAPEPLFVWLSETVGFCEALQQMPRAVTGKPPSEITLPPPIAVVLSIFVMFPVATVGALPGVLVTKLT